MPKEDQYIIAMRWDDQVERVVNSYDSLVKLQFKVVIIFWSDITFWKMETQLPVKVMASLPPIKHSLLGHADVVAFSGTSTLVPHFVVKFNQIAAIDLEIGHLQMKSMDTHFSNLQ